jgi:hypothetical protein
VSKWIFLAPNGAKLFSFTLSGLQKLNSTFIP